MKRDLADRETTFEFNISAYSEADRFYKSGQFREALKLFKAALGADPSDGDAYHAIGSCYDALLMPARAAAAYQSALPLVPSDRHPALHFNIGNAFLDLGRYREALAEYQLVPKQSPVWPTTSKNMKLALERIAVEG